MADSQRKTANLFDVSTQTVGAFVRAGNITAEKPLGNIEAAAGYNLSAYIAVIPNTIYTIKYPVTSVVGGAGLVYYSDNNGTTISGIPLGDQGQTYTFTTPNNCNYIRFSYDNTQGIDVMLNSGSQPLPYEPYWQHSLRKLATFTDTITTLPADIYANDTTATVGLKGNMQQIGTPTPQNPITPSETGERTANLFDGTTSGTNQRISIQNGATYASNGYSVTQYIEIEPSTRYTHNKSYECYYALYDENKSFLYGSGIRAGGGTSGSFANAKYLRIDCSTSDISTFMVVNGTTPSSEYIPYGYKLDIKSGNTTTPVYLGEAQTTRKIKKYEFTGSETWNVGSENFYCFVPETSGDGVPYSSVICSHCSGSTINGTRKAVFVKKSEFPNITTGAELKQFCADQYAAGTPVCIWYVLATEETGIVNEPLRKIGDYADTVSGVNIPTTTGKDSFDVLTTLKPSEVSLNYTGWHDASAKEWNGSQWQ